MPKKKTKGFNAALSLRNFPFDAPKSHSTRLYPEARMINSSLAALRFWLGVIRPGVGITSRSAFRTTESGCVLLLTATDQRGLPPLDHRAIKRHAGKILAIRSLVHHVEHDLLEE